ncbi:MAG: hypothetical protein L0241_06570 [Planctomycetia bacterium]|nr:hypothetical protein [Planctomycetia bacterium]
MDELIKTVSEKAGINPEQAKVAVNSVIEFIKGKLPGIGEQVQGMLTGGEGSGVAGNLLDAARKKFGI